MTRIVRIETATGPQHAAQQSDGSYCLIAGDLFGNWSVTTQSAPANTRLLAPVAPPTIYCIGLNYRKHAQETGAAIPQYPVLFIKANAALHHPGQPILIPLVAAMGNRSIVHRQFVDNPAIACHPERSPDAVGTKSRDLLVLCAFRFWRKI